MTHCAKVQQKSACSCSASPVPEWISLPVFPHASARSRFCGLEKLALAIPTYGAMNWLEDLKQMGKRISGVDLNGPGDPLATLSMTLDVLDLLRKNYPEIVCGLTTLGLGLSENIDQLQGHGVSKVTILMDAVSPEIMAKIYAWIRPGKRNIPLKEGVDILISEQARGIKACYAAGISVAIQSTVFGDINEEEIGEIARIAADLGAETMELVPGKGWLESKEDVPLSPPSTARMAQLGKLAAQYITISKPENKKDLGEIVSSGSCPTFALPKPSSARPNVAVLSSNGMDIDLHLGQAIKALIYGPREDGLACLLEARDLPEPGGGEKRWQQVADTLADCFVLLTESAGQKPREILGKHGLPVVLINDNVEGTVDVLYGGGKKGKC